MKLKIYSVFDVKTDMFMTPFFMSTNGQAMRAFSDLASDKNTTVGRHPEDYKLLCIGLFDDEQGVVTPMPHDSLGFATDFVGVQVQPGDNSSKLRKV